MHPVLHDRRIEIRNKEIFVIIANDCIFPQFSKEVWNSIPEHPSGSGMTSIRTAKQIIHRHYRRYLLQLQTSSHCVPNQRTVNEKDK